LNPGASNSYEELATTAVKRVAIVVPSYQCEATIAETLQSIENQGDALYRVQEVIVADDASTDQTREVARRCWQADVPLRVLKPPYNRGEYVNVNETVAGLAENIEWILIMHGDNVAKHEWLVNLLERVDRASATVASISSSWDGWRVDGTICPGEDNLSRGIEEIKGTPDAVRGTLRRGCWWHISSCAIRVAAFKGVGGLPKGLRLKGDWDFLLRVLAAGWSIEYIPRTLMRYRENPSGSSSRTFRLHQDIVETLQVIRWHSDVLSVHRVAALHMHQTWILTRRCVGSVVRWDGRRLIAAVPVGLAILISFAKCTLGIRDARPSSMFSPTRNLS
jgi:glycosyltransferase involved in cell wall biosynthesis